MVIFNRHTIDSVGALPPRPGLVWISFLEFTMLSLWAVKEGRLSTLSANIDADYSAISNLISLTTSGAWGERKWPTFRFVALHIHRFLYISRSFPSSSIFICKIPTSLVYVSLLQSYTHLYEDLRIYREVRVFMAW